MWTAPVDRPTQLPLTSSSLYQDSDSAVSTNQYSLEPPFIRLMLLMVSQPLRITWGGRRASQAQQQTTATTQPGLPPAPSKAEKPGHHGRETSSPEPGNTIPLCLAPSATHWKPRRGPRWTDVD